MLLLLVLFGRLKAKVRAGFPIPNRTPASLGASPQPGSSHVCIAEALPRKSTRMRQDGVVPMRLPHMFLDLILQGAEDRDSRERVSGRKQVPSSVPAAQPNPS